MAYTESIGAREEDLVALFVNAASDEVLQQIERHLHDDLTFEYPIFLSENEEKDLRTKRSSEYEAKLQGRVREFYT